MSAIDEDLIRGWLAARSLARGLPAPVADRGGWRVDSGQPEEKQRYLFAHPIERLRALGEEITEPLVALKLCATEATLLSQLPARWHSISEPGTCVMVREGELQDSALPPGYRLEVEDRSEVTAIRILNGEELAASGFAAELDGIFIYDRIRTEAAHQRRGLGRALMAALGRMRRTPAGREILTATPMGAALYRTIGWHDYSAYSTAMISA